MFADPGLVAEVARIIRFWAPGVDAFAFGSLVHGRALKPTSDLDICLRGVQPIQPKILRQVRDAFEISDLPMRVDVVDWYALSTEFQTAIAPDLTPIVVSRADKPMIRPTAAESSNFDPGTLGFIRLDTFQFPSGTDVFERKNHKAVDGTHDVLRLNYYLSKHHDFVTLWWGLLEPLFAERHYQQLVVAHQLNFQEMYTERLFQGHIQSNEDAAVILRATGVVPSNSYLPRLPQILEGGPTELRCEVMT